MPLTWQVWATMALVTGAVTRATRLVVTDDVTAPLRLAVTRRWPPAPGPSWPARLVHCPWCVAMWLAAAAVAAACTDGVTGWAAAAGWWLTVAFAAGWLAEKTA